MRHLYIYDFDLLPILFPEYRVTSMPGYLPKRTIFVGRELVQGEEDSFCAVRMLIKDVSLSIPDQVSAFNYAVAKKFAGTQPKSLERYVEKLRKEEFMKELRYFMALGKWRKLSDVEAKVYQLFATLTESKIEFLKTYFTLRSMYSFEELWKSILTFFVRVVHFDSTDPNISDYYKGVISKFKNQSSKISKVVQFVTGNHWDEMSMLEFVLEVR